jgi:hypothetical protein
VREHAPAGFELTQTRPAAALIVHLPFPCSTRSAQVDLERTMASAAVALRAAAAFDCDQKRDGFKKDFKLVALIAVSLLQTPLIAPTHPAVRLVADPAVL